MCGRFSLSQAEKQMLQDRFGLDEISIDLVPRYNIAPTQDMTVIRNDSPTELSTAKFGLIPHWAKDANIGYKMINARAETIAEKPAYKKPFETQRCLIIADSFYEWKKANGAKIPYRILLKDESVFAFAGVWDSWNGTITAAIVTTQANDFMSKIHDRMPVILHQDREKEWLNATPAKALKILGQSEPELKSYRVSTLVNNARNESPELIKEVKSGLSGFM
jgi:putative SOS response-associated peptidase YedK